jgi:hypothetical protein
MTSLVGTYAHPNEKGAQIEVHYTSQGWLVIERDQDGKERARRAPMHVGVAKAPKGYVVTGEFIDGHETYGTYPTAEAAKATLKHDGAEHDPFEDTAWRYQEDAEAMEVEAKDKAERRK